MAEEKQSFVYHLVGGEGEEVVVVVRVALVVPKAPLWPLNLDIKNGLEYGNAQNL